MPILVVCPSCAQKLRAPDKMAGRKIKCPKCGKAVVVPGPDEGTARPAPAIQGPLVVVDSDLEEDSDVPGATTEVERDRGSVILWMALGFLVFALATLGATLWWTGMFSKSAQQGSSQELSGNPSTIRLGIDELRAGDLHDDLEVAGEKFDEKFKGKTLEIYGMVGAITRHKQGQVTIFITVPWADANEVVATIPHPDWKKGLPGFETTLAETERLTLFDPILVRCRCRGFKPTPTYVPGFPAAPLIAVDPQLIQIPQGSPGSPLAWKELKRMEHLDSGYIPHREKESISGDALMVHVRLGPSLAEQWEKREGFEVQLSEARIAEWLKLLYAFRFGNDPTKRITLIDDSNRKRMGEYTPKDGLVRR